MALKYIEQWEYQGSGKKPYVISLREDGLWLCSCPGWTMHVKRDVNMRVIRKDCKHITYKKSEYTHLNQQGEVVQLAQCHECWGDKPVSQFITFDLCSDCHDKRHASGADCDLCGIVAPKIFLRSIRSEGL